MDVIDKRNFQEKMARSIIKRQNVHYVSQEELNGAKQEEEMRAREVLARLQAEAEADEAALQAEIAAILQAQERKSNYNEKTHANSGEYGKEGFSDDITKSQIKKILDEKEAKVRKTMEDTWNNQKD